MKSNISSQAKSMTSVYSVPSKLFPPPPNFPNKQVEIFVGDGFSAAIVDQLEQFNVEGILNVAYDLDDQPSDDEHSQGLALDPNRPAPDTAQGLDGEIKLQRYKQQFAKVGLIDGYGNIANQMSIISAVYMAEQLFTFPPGLFPPNDSVCPKLVNDYSRGNLLIHCWSGRSRSVTVAALYIWYKFAVQLQDPHLSSFGDVYNRVKAARGDSLNPVEEQPGAQCVPSNSTRITETPPTCGMQAAAWNIVETYKTLFPVLTLR